MKVRNGFVSNSSSSSFVIECTGQTKTVRDVATIMIKVLIDELNEERWYSDWKKDIKEKKQWIKDLESIDENHSVHFPSCNYDTWIKKVGNRILVSTCNNSNWELPNQSIMTEEVFNELKCVMSDKEYEEFVEYYYEFYLDSYFKDFYSLNFGIVGREVKYDWNNNYKYDNTICKKERNSRECGQYLWETKLGIKCPICDIELFKRKEKLEKLDKLSN